ncbi:NAD-dependent epimerase/dehydratase family protein [Mucilaginibacter calamicampi]|uniref:NAD-dependent epimerase/dehydratase family protein n=1 Tax=Mucilaginibacter calamicampi TaxID=1302352 RepID=A0ABW2YTQ0_9SPHI
MSRILLTGANGFLGKSIATHLSTDFIVDTIGRKKADIVVDLAKDQPHLTESYTYIIHAAGKAHSVPKTDAEKQDFFDVNLTGTQNLLNALDNAPHLPKYFVFISSVSVYGAETGNLIAENAPLQAKDPYGESKIRAEQLIYEWCAQRNVVCTVLRLPLLAGTNPPGNLGAMIKGIKKGYYFNISGGSAKKSIVLAEDIAKTVLTAAKIGGTYNLTDRYHPSFKELSECIAKQLNKSKPLSMPLFIAKLMAGTGDLIGNKFPINSKSLNKILSDLTFDDSSAVKAFGWNPTPVLKGFKIA